MNKGRDLEGALSPLTAEGGPSGRGLMALDATSAESVAAASSPEPVRSRAATIVFPRLGLSPDDMTQITTMASPNTPFASTRTNHYTHEVNVLHAMLIVRLVNADAAAGREGCHAAQKKTIETLVKALQGIKNHYGAYLDCAPMGLGDDDGEALVAMDAALKLAGAL